MRKKISRTMIGICFILAGVGFAGNFFELWEFNLFFDGWWTLFLIVPGIISIISRGFDLGNIIVTGVGVTLLLESQNLIKSGMTFKMIWPAILVIIGIAIIYRGFFGEHFRLPKKTSDEKFIDSFALFGGFTSKNNSIDFKGGNATSIFGGIDLDLREAVINENINFNVTAIFGGAEIKVPPNVRVEMKGLPIFGGFDDKSYRNSVEPLHTITFNCLAIFGGIEVL